MKLYLLCMFICLTTQTAIGMQQTQPTVPEERLTIALASILYPLTPNSIHVRKIQRSRTNSYDGSDGTIHEAALILEQLRIRSRNVATKRSSHDSQELQLISSIIITPPEDIKK